MKVRILCLVMLVGLVSRPAVASSVVTFQPASSSVAQFDTFIVDIAIADAADLVGFQFDLAFDPAILSANSIDEGGFLGTAGATFFIPGTIDNSLGTITFTAAGLIGNGPGATGAGALAQVSFFALAQGSSALTLSNGLFQSLLRDANGDLVIDTDPTSPFFGDFVVQEIQIPFEDGGVTVNAPVAADVPEPATLVLVGTGIAAAWRRRAKARAA